MGTPRYTEPALAALQAACGCLCAGVGSALPLADETPLFPDVWRLVSSYAGASVAGAEALGGRVGGRWAAGEKAGRHRGSLLGSLNSPPGGLRGGDHASCAKWSKTEPKSSFSRGSRPGPPAGIPAPPEHGDWPRRGRFRVLLRATLLPDGCPVGVRRQVWTAQGGLKPP